MKVKVIKAFRYRGQILEVGTVLTIRSGDYPRLYLLAAPAEPVSTEIIQAEYFSLLSRFWSLDDDPAVTMDEARRLVDRLDALYKQLHQAGRKVPIRLPIERLREHTQEELAL